MANWGQLNSFSFNRCHHRIIGDQFGRNDATEDCCASVACSLCLKLLDDYDGEIIDGVSMAGDGSGYSGSVGGHSFRGEWSRQYGTDRCIFTVIIDEGTYDEAELVYYKCPEYGEEGMGCMNPAGEYQTEDGLLVWEVPEIVKLPRTLGYPPPACVYQIALLLDVTDFCFPYVSDFADEIDQWLNAVQNVAADYQISLITFDTDGASVVVPFETLNNRVQIKEAVQAITESGEIAPEYIRHRFSGSAIKLADDMVWHGAVRNITMLQMGVSHDSETGLISPTNPEQILHSAKAASLSSKGVPLNTLMVTSELTVTADSDNNAALSTGSFVTFDPSGLTPLINKFVELVSSPIMCDEGTVTTLFCGDCDCIPKKLCVTITGPSCEVKKIFELEEDPYATSECPDVIEWPVLLTCGSFTLDGVIALRKGIYGECEFSLTTEDFDDVSSPGVCPDIAGSWTIEEDYVEYTVNAGTAKCNSCVDEVKFTPCCDRTDIPRTLYLTIASTENCDCNNWEGVVIELKADRITYEESELTIWAGCYENGPCSVINGVEVSQSMTFLLSCLKNPIGVNGTTNDFLLYKRSVPSEATCEYNLDSLWSGLNDLFDGVGGPISARSQCEPLRLVLEMNDDPRFIVHCQDAMAPTPGNKWTIIITE